MDDSFFCVGLLVISGGGGGGCTRQGKVYALRGYFQTFTDRKKDDGKNKRSEQPAKVLIVVLVPIFP